jgi:hypothetical protein
MLNWHCNSDYKMEINLFIFLGIGSAPIFKHGFGLGAVILLWHIYCNKIL